LVLGVVGGVAEASIPGLVRVSMTVGGVNMPAFATAVCPQDKKQMNSRLLTRLT